MGAMGGPQSAAAPSKGAATPGMRWSSSAMKPGAATRRRKPMNLTVDVENLDPPSPHLVSTSPIEKHIMVDASATKPRRNSSSSFLQPDQFMSELKVIQTGRETGAPLKVKTGATSLPVSDSPKSARSVRSIWASFETPRNDAAVWEPPSPPRFRKSPKPFEWNGEGTDQGEREAQSRKSRSVVSHQSQSEFETFYDSLPTLESPESPRWESLNLELPKLELSYEGKPAPAPAHLRVRTASTLPLSEKPHPESAAHPSRYHPEGEPQKSSSSSSKGASPALLKLQAKSFLLGSNSSSPAPGNMRPGEKLRSASSRKESSVSQSEDHTSSHSQPLKPTAFDVEEMAKGHVKTAGLLRRMLHWGASKLGKKSSGSKNGGKDNISKQTEPSKPESKPEAMSVAVKVEATVEAKVGAEREKEVTDGEVVNLDPDSPRSSVSSVGTTFSDVSSKSHKHKRHLKSEVVKSKLWLLRVHQKLQGRASKAESGDESDGGNGNIPAVRGATFHGFTDASSNKTVDKKMLTASARFNPERSAISKLIGGKHRRNSTWDAGKISPTEHLFSPKQKLPKSDAQGLLTPPRRLTGDTTDFTRRRRPTSLTTGDNSGDKLFSPSPSPRRMRPGVNSTRVAPDGDDSRQTKSVIQKRSESRQAGVPLPTAPTAGTFLQTAAMILASPGSKDEPNNQLFENSRKGVAAPNLQHTPPISPTGVSPRSQRTGFGGFKGFNSPLPLPIRVTGTQGYPTSPVYPASSPGNRFAKSPGRYRDASSSPTGASTPTSPGLFAPSPGWSGMQSDPSSPGMFAPSPGWVEMQRSPRSPRATVTSPRGTGFQTSQVTSQILAHARSHGSITGDQLLLEDISFTTLVKRPVDMTPAPKSAQPQAATPRNGVAVTGAPKPRSESKTTESSSEQFQKSGSVSGLSSPRPQVSGISFEQIVAGRNRSPPTDNTLMKFFFKCREIEHLNKFLALQKKRFLESFSTDSDKCFHMILSEADQGLSSMISTLCTAWLLENTMASASVKWHPIPVMNMCQKEMWQHRDAAWLFHVCGIEPNVLLFIDEVTLTPETVVAGRVKRAVTGQDILQTKDEVASSCTVVSEKFRQEAPKLLQARYMKTLLLAGILVDTKNLATGSSRDKQQATILLVGAGSLGRNGFYRHLVDIRDENYETTFIKEIYGDSNALSVEQPAPKEPGVEQSKPMSRPTSIITSEEPKKATSLRASRKSEPLELKLRSKSAPGRKSDQPEVKNKVPLNKRGWFRNRPSGQ